MKGLGLQRVGAVTLGLLALTSGCARKNEGPTAGDSVTNWLQACADDGACRGGAQCIASLCTLSCAAAGALECAPLGATAICEASTGACDLPCATHDACRALGPGYRCERDRCRAPATDAVGGEDAGEFIETADAASVADAVSGVDTAHDGDASFVADAASRGEAAPLADAGPSWRLGMNDVTILTPLPSDYRTPVLLRGTDLDQDGAPLIPQDLFDRLAVACLGAEGLSGCSDQQVLLAQDYQNLHLVALRFDLCDRDLPGTCAVGEDARLRLVW